MVLAPELAAAAASSATLFIIARRQGVETGPPVAVVRVPQASFPFEFEIGQANVMIPGTQFAGKLTLSARLDSDGNVMSRLPGDLASESSAAFEPGSAGVVIVLSQKI